MRIGNRFLCASIGVVVAIGIGLSDAQAANLTGTLTTAARGVFKTAGGTPSHKLTQEEFKQAEPMIQTALDKLVDRGVIGSGAPMIPVLKPDLSMEEEISVEQFALYFRYVAYEEDQLIQTAHDKQVTRAQAVELRAQEMRLRAESIRASEIRAEADRQRSITEQQRIQAAQRDPDQRPEFNPPNTNTPLKHGQDVVKSNPQIAPATKINVAPATTTGKPAAPAGQVQLTTPPANNGNNNGNKPASQGNSNNTGTSRVAVAPTPRPTPPPPDRTPAKSGPSDNKSNSGTGSSGPGSKDTSKDDKSKTAIKK